MEHSWVTIDEEFLKFGSEKSKESPIDSVSRYELGIAKKLTRNCWSVFGFIVIIDSYRKSVIDQPNLSLFDVKLQDAAHAKL